MENKVDLKLAEKIVDLLNELIKLDKLAIAALIANHIPCNKELADHSTVQVRAQHEGYLVGLLGILNGICGVKANGSGVIQAVFTDKKDGTFEDLLEFRVDYSE